VDHLINEHMVAQEITMSEGIHGHIPTLYDRRGSVQDLQRRFDEMGRSPLLTRQVSIRFS